MSAEFSPILALIPAHNEAARIAPVIAGARQYLPVLVVDDGSTDDTARIANAAGAEVVRQSPNRGKGEALKAGFRWALERDFEAVLTLDADGQHDPAEIPAFLEKWAQTHADCIIGARNFRQMPLHRRLANISGTWLFSWAVGRPIRDNQSGYRLISRRLMENALVSAHGGFEFEVDMIVICIQHNYKLEWVNIRTIYGDEKSHIQPFRHVQGFIRLALATRRLMKQK
ncbi:glycosyltransferase family 2 protein [Anaerolinea sp.]|uniref:glycosyltransferase family 2 protein n=1 Tax=Anaerolinea sp. TaxID=1872519 RepID=UPI002ACEF876|nr:glycosyltransferase family 2 protein [Anaerolinea sp.]